jgi:predicted  nucleic acid-binding Zn-ribbon protein
VSIDLRCESCGKMLRATRERAGSRAQCPACGHELYIPMPQEELDELPMAPEDASELEREQALQEERRALDRALAREEIGGEQSNNRRPAPAAGRPATRPTAGGGANAREAVLAYLEAMRDANFDLAAQKLAVLQRQKSEARAVVDQLATDQLPPPNMANVPPGVYQGFLRNLRSQL